MLGDVPSIVPRRNYDIRTQCLKGTCSSSELPGRLACFLPRRCAPMPRLFVHVSPETSHGKDGYESHCWIRSIVLVFRMERMTGFEPAVSCLGSRRAATAPHPHCRAFFRIRRTAVTYSPPAERGMAGLRVGLTGFEPATPCSQSTCATKLRHNPIFLTGLRGLPATYVPY